MPILTLTVTEEEEEVLSRWREHMLSCRVCTRKGGTVAGLRGCSLGHYLSVRSAVILARALRTPAAGDPGTQAQA